jgi:hypothetical protein
VTGLISGCRVIHAACQISALIFESKINEENDGVPELI